jgi:ribosomal protein S16
MFKNYTHPIIRLRKGKKSLSQVYWIIAILNKKKSASHKVIEQFGYFKFGTKRICSINFKKLAYFLNKGFILNKRVRKVIYLHTII